LALACFLLPNSHSFSWLDDHLHINMSSGQRLLDVDGLREKLQTLCQWRIDSVFLRRNVIELAQES
jgi:hypothetical protein